MYTRSYAGRPPAVRTLPPDYGGTALIIAPPEPAPVGENAAAPDRIGEEIRRERTPEAAPPDKTDGKAAERPRFLSRRHHRPPEGERPPDGAERTSPRRPTEYGPAAHEGQRPPEPPPFGRPAPGFCPPGGPEEGPPRDPGRPAGPPDFHGGPDLNGRPDFHCGPDFHGRPDSDGDPDADGRPDRDGEPETLPTGQSAPQPRLGGLFGPGRIESDDLLLLGLILFLLSDGDRTQTDSRDAILLLAALFLAGL